MDRYKQMINKKYLSLGLILIIGFVTYALKATNTGLWYDEAIEYFYSKFMTGAVPGGFGTINMYERICSTYQPPLYNFLTYFWLLIFDTEFGFRLAGIVTTLIGAIGIFFAIDEQTEDSIWATTGTLLYIYTWCVAYYALECAEYNLMLCCVSWTVYFFVRTIKKRNTSSLVGFFLLACLSVYSQYGAAFIVVGMFFALLVHLIRMRDKQLLRKGAIITIVVGIVAIFPLVYFFLIPQMNKQGSAGISHSPVFTYNIIVDFIRGLVLSLQWDFGKHSVHILGDFICCAVGVAVLFTVFALFKKWKDIYYYVVAISIAWSIYFFAVACSFYGYNNWKGTLGCHNIGGKYAMFFVPIILVTLVSGVRVVLMWIKKRWKKVYKVMVSLCLFSVIIFCGTQIYKLDVLNWKKDDVREAAKAWYDSEAYHSVTLVHQWDDAIFQFYLRHDENYNELYQNGIEAAGFWIRSANYDKMKQKLKEMGYLDLDDFYYIAPINTGSYRAFIKVMQDNNFSIRTIYKGKTGLIHLEKKKLEGTLENRLL